MTPPKLTRTSLSPMPSPAAPTGIAAIARCRYPTLPVIYLTHRAVNDQTFPFILYCQTRQFSIDQCATNRTTAIDDKNTTTAILFEQIVQQPVVLETFYRDYLSAKRRPSAKVGEQRFHDVNIFLIDVTKLGSIVFHRLNIQLLREFSVYRAMWAVGKIINC